MKCRKIRLRNYILFFFLISSKITYFCNTFMYKKSLLSFFLGATLLTQAQTGENVYTFLNIPISARQAALGGDGVSIRDYDVSMAIVNP